MLTQLSTVKARLAISDIDLTFDALLTNAIKAVSAQFDRECRRVFARTPAAVHEFPGDGLELQVACYPIETVTRFQLKTSESAGWLECEAVEYLCRTGGIISLSRPLGSWREQARVTFAGGYVLPGETAGPGQAALPADLEHAAVEQVAWWFQNRDRLGLTRIWEYHATYRHFDNLELLRPVKAVLEKHTRWA